MADPLAGVKATAPKGSGRGMRGGMTVVVDTADVEALFGRAIAATGDAAIGRWMMGPLARWMEGETVQRFANEGDFRSEHWHELHDPTQDIRQYQGYDPNFPINVRTGELMDFALSYSVDREADGMTFRTPHPGKGDAITQQKFMTAQLGSQDNVLEEFGSTQPRPVIAWSDMADTETVLTMLTMDVARSIVGGLI